MNNMSYSEIIDQLMPYMERYWRIVEEGVSQRRSHLPQTKEGLVIGALMARIAALSSFLMFNPLSWNVYIGTPSLRTQAECYFILAWILKNINENSRRYIVTSIWRNKKNALELEKYLSPQKNETGLKNDANFFRQKREIEMFLAAQDLWRQKQMAEWKIYSMGKKDGMPEIVNMAKEADLLFDYKDLYNELSMYSHNSWYCVYRGNAELSHDGAPRNPLRGDMHNVLVMGMSAKYLTRAYKVIDKNYNLKINAMSHEECWMQCALKMQEIFGE